jgi:uncharacterized cupin superfamily protein
MTAPFVANIKNWRELEMPAPRTHWATGEDMGYVAPFSRTFGFGRVAFHHRRLMPGWRSAPPHAERHEEEMIVVLEGEPTLWSDGHVMRLKRGHAAGWPSGTGHGHCIINDTNEPVRILTIGEASRDLNSVAFPVSPEVAAKAKTKNFLWEGAPAHKLGGHDGLSNVQRGNPHGLKFKSRPDAVFWQDIQGKDTNTYPGDKEKLAVGAHLSQHLGLRRISVWLDELKPGRRTSWPHAERDEEEFVYVFEGEPDVWIDGHLYRLTAGDCVGWPSGTGQAHTVINNSDKPVRLIVGGEASRRNSGVWYPLHPKRNKALKERLWTDVPKRKMGPHDGKPDALRAAKKKRTGR